ncbi:B3 domain-containing protein REM20-like [Arachis stenosperma]|uniref:B3 domain-containing protein REM20-like n=1 Tax=Arachis stenosperma TaxID=217475 RepID=UPI0025AD0E09|nr:B3 domain-containing protein REM20-like [Arachis stenosperma]
MNTSAEQSSFFKVFLPQFSSEKLLLPKEHVALTRMKERVPEEFMLRNGRGGAWRVKTSCIGEKVYFDDGWKEFVRDNGIQEACVIIVFNPDGSSTFEFKIFESSMCEKTQTLEEEAAVEMEESSEEEEEEENDDDDDDDDDDDEDYEDEDEDEDEMDHHRAGKAPGKRERGNYNDIKEYGEIIATFIDQHNPYFVFKRNKSRPNELHVPCKLIKEYSITIPETIKLCCKYIKVNSPEKITVESSPWPAFAGRSNKWKDGRVCIKGWGGFCRRNNVNASADTFICELKMSKNMKIVKMIQVYVVKKQP